MFAHVAGVPSSIVQASPSPVASFEGVYFETPMVSLIWYALPIQDFWLEGMTTLRSIHPSCSLRRLYNPSMNGDSWHGGPSSFWVG